MTTDAAYNNYLNARGTDDEEVAILELFKALRQHAKSVIYLVLKRCEPDLEADILYTTWFKKEQFQGKSRFSTWFHRLAINKCRDFISARKSNREFQFLDENYSSEINNGVIDISQPELAKSEIFCYLRDNISEQETALLESIVAGYHYREIGEMLGVKEATARVRWFKLKKKLIKLLEKRP